jgi:hypothetical protein
MAEKLLISVSAQKLTAGRWRGRALSECSVFATDEAGYSACRDYLVQFPAKPVSILVDAVEEDYRFEMLPHTFGADRRALVARKLKQHYRSTPYSAATLQGRDTGRRRDDRYLFSALTNPDLLAPCLQMVQDLRLALAGVYLLPTVAGALLEKLRLPAPNVLLIAQHSGGLRLTYFAERQFRVSRLTRADFSRSGDLAQLFAEEITNTRLYLHALHIATLEDHLAVVILDRNDELAAMTARLAHDSPGLACVRLGSAQLAATLGVQRTLLATSSDVIYLQLLGQQAPPGNLAPHTMTGAYRQYQARRWLYGACAAATGVAVVWNSYLGWEIAQQHKLLAATVSQTTRVEQQYAEVTRQFPPAPASAVALAKAVQIAGQLQEKARTPERMMGLIARAFDRSPGITLKALTWRYAPGAADARAITTATNAVRTGTAAAGGDPRVESGLIECELRPFNGDYRAAMEAIHALREQLARDPAVADARIVKLPLNVDPAVPLAGNTSESRERNSSAEFKMLVVLRTSS